MNLLTFYVSVIFLTESCPSPAGFFLWRGRLKPMCFSLYTPDLPSSHCHSFPCPPFGTGKLISPSCRAEFLSLPGLCLSACQLDSPIWGLLLHASCWSFPCRCTRLEAATDICSFVFLTSPRIPITGCTLTSQPQMRVFFPGISQCVERFFHSLVRAPFPLLLSLSVFHHKLLWWITHVPWSVHPCNHAVLWVPSWASSPLWVSPVYTYTLMSSCTSQAVPNCVLPLARTHMSGASLKRSLPLPRFRSSHWTTGFTPPCSSVSKSSAFQIPSMYSKYLALVGAQQMLILFSTFIWVTMWVCV